MTKLLLPPPVSYTIAGAFAVWFLAVAGMVAY